MIFSYKGTCNGADKGGFMNILLSFILAVISIAAVFAIIEMFGSMSREWQRAFTVSILLVYVALLWIQPDYSTFYNLLVLATSASGAFLLAGLLGGKRAIAVFAITFGLIDI